MAKYPKLHTTNKGRELVSVANVQNKAVTYTKAVLGDGSFSGNIDALTNIIAAKMECPFNSATNIGDGQFQLDFVIDNGNLQSGFYAREVGIFAKIDNGEEILFAYTNGGNYVDYIPDKSTPIDAQIIEANINIGDAESVTIVKSDSTYLTFKDLQNHNTDATAHTAILDAHNADVNAHSVAFSSVLKKSDIQVITGEVANGGTIPLPEGFLESECKWFAGIKHSNVNEWRIDVAESNRSNLLAPICTLNGRVVTVGTQVAGLNGGSYTDNGPIDFGNDSTRALMPGTAWYICIGIHR